MKLQYCLQQCVYTIPTVYRYRWSSAFWVVYQIECILALTCSDKSTIRRYCMFICCSSHYTESDREVCDCVLQPFYAATIWVPCVVHILWLVAIFKPPSCWQTQHMPHALESKEEETKDGTNVFVLITAHILAPVVGLGALLTYYYTSL